MLTDASMSRADLKLAIAQRAQRIIQDSDGKEVADPTNPTDDRLNTALRNGVRDFWHAHDWSFNTQFVQLTLQSDGTGPINIEGDPCRYLMPENILSVPRSSVLFKGPEATTGGGRAAVRHFDEVMNRTFLDPNSVGVPQMVGVEWNQTNRPGMRGRGQFSLAVWPKPDRNYTIGFRARVTFVPLVEDTQYGNWPAVHDRTVVAFAVRDLFQSDRNPDSPWVSAADKDAGEMLAMSIRVDDEDYRPQTLGPRDADTWPSGRAVSLFNFPTNETILTATAYA